jgi:drug/metabolite transporter (DMT)-like permease
MASVDGFIMSLLKALKTGLIKNSLVFPISMILYSFQPIVFYNALSIKGMAVLNILWNVISNVIVTLLAVIVFGEVLSAYQWVGIVTCLVGIVLVGSNPESTHPKTDAVGELGSA